MICKVNNNNNTDNKLYFIFEEGINITGLADNPVALNQSLHNGIKYNPKSSRTKLTKAFNNRRGYDTYLQ